MKTIDVDIAGICSVSHHCTGCEGSALGCCSSYEVIINSKELDNIIGYLHHVSQYCPHLKIRNGYKNVFEQISPNLYAIDTKEDESCVFAYALGDRLLCSLHTVAVELNIPLKDVKPLSCLLWPLAIFEGKPRVLSIHDDVFDFSCCNSRNAHENDPLLCPSILKNIEMVFGSIFKSELVASAQKGLQWTRIPLLEDTR